MSVVHAVGWEERASGMLADRTERVRLVDLPAGLPLARLPRPGCSFPGLHSQIRPRRTHHWSYLGMLAEKITVGYLVYLLDHSVLSGRSGPYSRVPHL